MRLFYSIYWFISLNLFRLAFSNNEISNLDLNLKCICIQIDLLTKKQKTNDIEFRRDVWVWIDYIENALELDMFSIKNIFKHLTNHSANVSQPKFNHEFALRWFFCCYYYAGGGPL